jgi:hypothetical protein
VSYYIIAAVPFITRESASRDIKLEHQAPELLRESFLLTDIKNIGIFLRNV